MINSLIIEDEAKGRETLINYLKSECPDIEVIGEAKDINEGINKIQYLQPDLVFLDISLPGGTAFDILANVKHIDFELIFVTAYDDFTLDAIRNSNCTDYLVKPISIEELKNAVEKVRIKLSEKSDLSILQKLDSQYHKLAIPTLERYEIIEIDKILFCEADRAWTTIHMLDDSKIISSKNLAIFERTLINYNFFRTHRSYLINLSHLKAYIKGRGGIAVLSSDVEIPISETNRQAFLEKLNVVR